MLLKPTAVILTSEEQEDPTKQRPLIRFFVSYAHADDARVKRLQESLEKELQIRKQFHFEVWSDRKIEVGENWDEKIQEALEECHFGLLFLSRDFLLSKYITENELPLFVNGTKPVIPVGLRSLDLAATDLKGLEAKQLYRLKRDGEEPRFFDQCRGGNLPQEFVLDLANQIEKRVASWLESDASRKSKPVSRDRKSPGSARSMREDDDEPDPFHELVTELGHSIIDGTNLPTCPVAPEAAPADLHTWEKNASILTQNRTKAVDYLSEWATSGEGLRFAAVLGETGIGKTTTLMLLSRELDCRRKKDPTVPAVIFIDLKDYYFDGDPDLEDILAEVIKRHWKGRGGRKVDPSQAIPVWTALLEDPDAPAQARRAAFLAWLVAHLHDWPVPAPKKAQLHDLDLEAWKIGFESDSKPPIDLRGASLKGARLDRAVLQGVLLSGADATGASARLAELHKVTLTDSIWETANLCGGTWRDCEARDLKAATANWHDCDVIRCEWNGAELPESWESEAAAAAPGSSSFGLVQCLAQRGPVQSVAWSPDGARLLSGGDDNPLKVWDAESGRCLHTLSAGDEGSVWSVAWSPDGARLLSGGIDNTLKVWDAESGRCLHTLSGHGNWVQSVAWSPDGDRLLSGGDDNTLKVWDAESGRCLHTLPGHGNWVQSVAWSPDGTRLLSGGDDRTIREWDAETGALLRTWMVAAGETALLDFPGNRILHASPGAWRYLGWQGFDEEAGRRRLLPAEIFGPLPPW